MLYWTDAIHFLFAGSFVYYFGITADGKTHKDQKLGRHKPLDVCDNLGSHRHRGHRCVYAGQHEYLCFPACQSLPRRRQHFFDY